MEEIIMEKIGHVSLTDLKDDESALLKVGKTYNYRVKNTDDHGRFKFIVRQEIDDYREEESDSYTENLVKITVEPGETKTGTFKVKDGVLGVSETETDSVDFIIKYIVTIYNANYTFKVWYDLPTATVSES